MHIQIDNSSNDPLYLQIKNQLKASIIAGDLSPGEKLPSIRFLSKELRISMITSKRAFDELEKEGFIHSVQGKGNFVASQNKELIREEYLKKIEENIQEILKLAYTIDLSIDEIIAMIENMEGDEYDS